MTAGLLAMHALAPCGLDAHEHAEAQQVTAVVSVPHDCPGGGDCGGSHLQHADPTCVSGAVAGGPEPLCASASPTLQDSRCSNVAWLSGWGHLWASVRWLRRWRKVEEFWGTRWCLALVLGEELELDSLGDLGGGRLVRLQSSVAGAASLGGAGAARPGRGSKPPRGPRAWFAVCTLWRRAGRVSLRPCGRPGPGREGFGFRGSFPVRRGRRPRVEGSHRLAVPLVCAVDSVGDLGVSRCGSMVNGHARVVPLTDAVVVEVPVVPPPAFR
ncbi:DUF6153 family protein [Streptomyces sp. NPDC048419]|uniref:DUF6153 family protein n=1 Tax=Streptomyces sp. NPDC048419 TaxID=3365547 RepID=UPI00371EE6EA